MLFQPMKLDSCGIPEDQFIEIFKVKTQFLGKLLIAFHPSAKSIMDEKIAWDMFQECVYATEAEAYKIANPESKDDLFGPVNFVSRDDIMAELQSVNAKFDALVDNIATLAEFIETTINT